jgi:chromate transporter
MILIRLFFAFVQIGIFAFGGGEATLSLIRKIIVEQHSWISSGEFAHLIAISQLTPGSISINAATYIGYKIAGVAGATVATIGVSAPTVALTLIILWILRRYGANIYIRKFLTGLRPVIIALIITAAYSIAFTDKGITDFKGIIIAIVAFAVFQTHKINPALVLLSAGVIGLFIYPA